MKCGPDGVKKTPSGSEFLASLMIYAAESKIITVADKAALNGLIASFPKNASALGQFFEKKSTKEVDDLLASLDDSEEEE